MFVSNSTKAARGVDHRREAESARLSLARFSLKQLLKKGARLM
jgi:hypothetical protein